MSLNLEKEQENDHAFNITFLAKLHQGLEHCEDSRLVTASSQWNYNNSGFFSLVLDDKLVNPSTEK